MQRGEFAERYKKASETLVPVLPVTSISSLDSVYATHFLSVNPDKDSHPSTVPIVEDVNAEPVKRGTEMKIGSSFGRVILRTLRKKRINFCTPGKSRVYQS